MRVHLLTSVALAFIGWAACDPGDADDDGATSSGCGSSCGGSGGTAGQGGSATAGGGGVGASGGTATVGGGGQGEGGAPAGPLTCTWPTGYEHNSCCWRGDASYQNCPDGPTCCASGIADYTDPGSWPQGWQDFEEQVVVLVNQHRAAGYDCGDPYGYLGPTQPVSMNSQLREAARRHSVDQALHEFVGHVGSDGSMPEDRMLAAGYPGTPSLENAGGGYGPWDSGPYSDNNARTPEVMVASWMASSGHCKTIMRPNLFDDPAQDRIDEIGVGYTNMNRTHDPDLTIGTMVSHRRWTLVIGASGQ